MRPIDENTSRALSGSRSGDRIVVWVWYGGRLALPEPLPVDTWSLSGDVGRAAGLSLSVSDPTGKLAPWVLEDPLGVGGARLQATYLVGGAGAIPLGWFRITRSEPDEEWLAYTIDEAGTVTPDAPVNPGQRLAVVPGGASVDVSADDLTVVLGSDRLVAPESPPVGATALSEIRRMCADIIPVTVAAGVVDVDVSRQLVYDQQTPRLEVVQDLAARLSAAVRVDGHGFLEVYPIQQASSIVLRGGPDGLLVRVSRRQDYSGLYNRFVVDGTADSERPVRAIADIAAGPLKVDPQGHGIVTKFYSSQLISTQEQADAYAREMRDTQLAGMTTDVQIVCAPVPQLQEGDWATVHAATADGRVIPLDGRVKAYSHSGGADGTKPTTLTLACSYAAVAAAFHSGSDLSLAGPVERNRPGVWPPGVAGPGMFVLSEAGQGSDGTWTYTDPDATEVDGVFTIMT